MVEDYLAACRETVNTLTSGGGGGIQPPSVTCVMHSSKQSQVAQSMLHGKEVTISEGIEYRFILHSRETYKAIESW